MPDYPLSSAHAASPGASCCSFLLAFFCFLSFFDVSPGGVSSSSGLLLLLLLLAGNVSSSPGGVLCGWADVGPHAPEEYEYHLDYQDAFECQRCTTTDSAMCRIINYHQPMQPARASPDSRSRSSSASSHADPPHAWPLSVCPSYRTPSAFSHSVLLNLSLIHI